jgi:hypothetical protein
MRRAALAVLTVAGWLALAPAAARSQAAPASGAAGAPPDTLLPNGASLRSREDSARGGVRTVDAVRRAHGTARAVPAASAASGTARGAARAAIRPPFVAPFLAAPHGHLIVEQYARHLARAGASRVDAGHALVRLGVGRASEVRIGARAYSAVTPAGAAAPTARGFAGLDVGARFAWPGRSPAGPRLAPHPALTIGMHVPMREASALAPDRWLPSASTALMWRLAPRVVGIAQGGIQPVRVAGRWREAPWVGLLVQRWVTPRLLPVTDVVRLAAPGQPAEWQFRGGVIAYANGALQLEARATALRRGAERGRLLTTGMAWRW